MAGAGVQETVGDQLPDPAMSDEHWHQAKIRNNVLPDFEPAQNELKQVDCNAGDDDASDPSGEGWKAERNGSSAQLSSQ